MNSQPAGRAGVKLEHALKVFSINPAGFICADFGSSVGGFVSVLLEREAKQVYSVETGYGILDWKLRNNPRVVVMERTNAMHVTLPEKVDLITIDASWTKQEHIVPNALKNLKPTGVVISLIKPHYEASNLVKEGKLDPNVASEVTDRVVKDLKNLGLSVSNPVLSPITGGKAGNSEYLVLIKPI